MTGFIGVADAERSFAEHEHRELIAGINEIDAAAGLVGWTTPANLLDEVRRVRDWYAAVLRPHATWEESVLYPEIDSRAGTEWATKLMRFEHQQISRGAAQLERDLEALQAVMTHEQACALRAHLTSLAALLRAHIEREDAFLLPLLAK